MSILAIEHINEFDTLNAGREKINKALDDANAVLREATDKDIISAPEIIVARGGAHTLGERLDSEKAESLAKVNEFETEIAVLSSSKADKTTLNETNNLVQGNYNRIQITKNELNNRIDTIIATPTTVSQQEIIDGRQGEPSLGANLAKIKQNQYKYKRNITSADNLENIMESGIYFAFNTSPVGTPSDLINVPYVLRVDNFSEAYCLQTIYSYLDSSIIYTRYVYVWETPKATPFLRIGGGYQKIIGSEINLNVDKLSDGLYWVLVGSQPLNAPSQLSSVSYMVKQELYHGQSYAIQTAYDIQKPQKMYRRWVYYYTGETTPWSLVGDDISVKPLTGKKLLTLGDSITFGATSTNHYQDKIAEITGAEVINAGYSGAKYALIAGHEPWNEFSFYQRTIDYDLTDIEYIFIMYGTNDYGNHVPIGTMDSDEYTVKGALVKGLTNLFTKKPNLKIFFSTPIFRATYDGTDFVDLDTKTNDLGLTIHDYSQAVLEVCEKLRLPAFDAQKECGINQLNHSVYLSDKLHLNNDGNDLIGSQFGNFIIQYV